MATFQEELSERASQIIDIVMANREAILEAFIAKYGCQPDEAVQVIQSDGNMFRWWVELKPKQTIQ